MKKTTRQQPSPRATRGTARKKTARKATARKAEPHLRNAARVKPATSAVAVLPEPAPAPTFNHRPETQAPLPLALARMLEEESWWRVVRVSSPAPVIVKKGSKSHRSKVERATVGRASSPR